MYCHRCGEGLPAEALFCKRCGTKVQETPPTTTGSVSSPKVTIEFDDYSQFAFPPFENNPQISPTQFDPGSQFTPPFGTSSQLPPVWPPPTSSLTPPQSFPVHPPLAPNAIQRLLLRIFGPIAARNALLGVTLGGVFAAIVGVIATAFLVAIAHALAPNITGGYSTGENIVDSALGIVPLHALLRDSLQLFLVMHGVSLHTQYDTTTFSSTAPLHGLLIVPALLLTLAGYIAASTDFENRKQSSLLRGAAIAIPYTVLLFIIASQVNGCIPSGSSPESNGYLCFGSSPSFGILSVDSFTLFIFGILWAALFGLLGASLKLAQGHWRHMMFQYLRSNSRPQLMGMLVGGLAASGLGLALALLALFSFMAYSSYSIPLLQQSTCAPSGDWQYLALWSLAQGPLHAVNLFFLSFGTPFNISHPQQFSCFYTRSANASISLFGSNPQLAPWTHLLLVLPVISLFIGGRVSTAIGRVQGIGPAALQGALIAVPFAVLMLLLSTISSIAILYTGGDSAVNQSTRLTAGASPFEILLWALLSGALLGALGGMYQNSTVKMSVRPFLTMLTTFLGVLSAPADVILDRFSGQSPFVQRTPARTVLYAAFLCTLVLVILAAVAGVFLIALNQLVSFDVNQHIRDILSVLLIALPGILLLSACAAALCYDSFVERQNYASTVQF